MKWMNHIGLLCLLLFTIFGCATNEKKEIPVPDTGEAIPDIPVRRGDKINSFAFGFSGSPNIKELTRYATVFLDGDANSSDISAVKASGSRLIGYISAGSTESGRSYYDELKEYHHSKMSGWDEYWLDTDRWPEFIAVIKRRIDELKAKGFLYIYFDNVDVAWNKFLNKQSNTSYIRTLLSYCSSVAVHCGINNGLLMIKDLAPYMSFSVTEQCSQYDECDYLTPMLGKTIYHLEYESKYCRPVEGHQVVLYSEEDLQTKYRVKNCE